MFFPKQLAPLLFVASAMTLSGPSFLAAQTSVEKPTDEQATLAYRNIGAVLLMSWGPPQDTIRVGDCIQNLAKPGIVCTVGHRLKPKAREMVKTVFFMKGPDGNWAATLE